MSHISMNQFAHSVLNSQQLRSDRLNRSEYDYIETKLYIGLNDADTKVQEHETAAYIKVLKDVCINFDVPFSFDVIRGGYIHDDGEYTEESTIELTFIGVEKDSVDGIAQELRKAFNQESVLITSNLVHARYIRESEDD